MWKNWIFSIKRLLSARPISKNGDHTGLTSLPNEILIEIFQYLTYWEVNVCLPRVCRRFRRIVLEERISRFTKLKMVLPPVPLRSSNSFDLEHPMIAGYRNGLKRSHFTIHPDLATLRCNYSTSRGLSCYLNDGNNKLSISDRADMISPILLEPVMFPPTSRMNVYINPIMSRETVSVFGGQFFQSLSNRVKTGIPKEKLTNCPVTMLDLTYWIATQLQENDPACKGFRLGINDQRITLRDDRSVDVHVYVHQVKTRG